MTVTIWRARGRSRPPSAADASDRGPALEFARIYREDLRREPSDTRVDPEGDVVWIQEYLRYRLTGCNHPDAVARSLLQVDGQGIQPQCR